MRVRRALKHGTVIALGLAGAGSQLMRKCAFHHAAEVVLLILAHIQPFRGGRAIR